MNISFGKYNIFYLSNLFNLLYVFGLALRIFIQLRFYMCFRKVNFLLNEDTH